MKQKRLAKLEQTYNHNLSQISTDMAVVKEQVGNIHEKITTLPCNEHTKAISEITGYMKSVIVIMPIVSAVVTGLAVYFLVH